MCNNQYVQKETERVPIKISIFPEARSLGRPVNPCFLVSFYVLLDVNALKTFVYFIIK